ncbi:MAG: hypothetical protein RSD98_13410, partial [Niameybacter sp.]
MSIKEVKHQDTVLMYNEETLQIGVKVKDEIWSWNEKYKPYFFIKEEKIYFNSAEQIRHFEWETGVGKGFRSQFKGFKIGEVTNALSFETIIWIEYATENVYFELVPLTESPVQIGDFYWPGEMAFTKKSHEWYSVVNVL